MSMSSESQIDLTNHQDLKENKKIVPKNFTYQEEIKLGDKSVSIEPEEKVSDINDVQKKDGSCEQVCYPVSSVKTVNQSDYSNNTKSCMIETSAEADSEKYIDKDIKNDEKIQLPESITPEEETFEEPENIKYNRGDFESRDSESDTEEHNEMGAMFCSNIQKEDKHGKSCDNSHDISSSDEQEVVVGAKRKKHVTKKYPKRYTQTTLNFSEKKEQPQYDNKHKTSHYSQTLDRTRRSKEREKNENLNYLKRFTDRDTENYRNGYPGQKDNYELKDNLRFYEGEIMSTPRGDFIDDIHKNWWGDFELLERHHGYIQWLFPIRESGMNSKAQPLQLHEAKKIRENPTMKKRVLKSYRLMLDFYGMKLQNEETGRLVRSENWKKCFHNLNRSSHNYLRITRILKCLGELGFEHLKKGLIEFILEEGLTHHTLVSTLTSCRDYWIGTIRDDHDREELFRKMDQYEDDNSW